jgi:hypothetical protein
MYIGLYVIQFNLLSLLKMEKKTKYFMAYNQTDWQE